MPSLRKFELVWAHVRGFSVWPGIIKSETRRGRYLIHFFGDYTVSEVGKNHIFHFMEGFNRYSLLEKPSLLLIKAVKEVKIFLFDDVVPNECYICKMLKTKAECKMKNKV